MKAEHQHWAYAELFIPGEVFSAAFFRQFADLLRQEVSYVTFGVQLLDFDTFLAECLPEDPLEDAYHLFAFLRHGAATGGGVYIQYLGERLKVHENIIIELKN